jgi:guanine deaminase
MSETERFLKQAIDLARENVRNGGRPFGAVVVKDGEVIATGVNETAATADPTAHAELMAVRAASSKLQSSTLDDCIVYASGHPCPKCFAAMALARVGAVFYAHSNEDGEPHGLSSAHLYDELARPADKRSLKMSYIRVRSESGEDLYQLWSGVCGRDFRHRSDVDCDKSS